MSRTVVVTGGRDFSDERFVFDTLDNLHAGEPITRLAHGGAKGADALAARWALLRKVVCVEYPADWRAYGREAGPFRNEAMIAAEYPDIVVAFPGGRGTAHCVSVARRLGLVIADLRRSYVPSPLAPTAAPRSLGGA